MTDEDLRRAAADWPDVSLRPFGDGRWQVTLALASIEYLLGIDSRAEARRRAGQWTRTAANNQEAAEAAAKLQAWADQCHAIIQGQAA